MKKTISILVAILLFGAVVFAPIASQAQSQGSTYNSTGAGSQGTSSTVDQNNNLGFNLWWLLPLLAIPLIIYAATRSPDVDDTYSRSHRVSMVGTKGGRSKAKKTDEVVDEDEN